METPGSVTPEDLVAFLKKETRRYDQSVLQAVEEWPKEWLATSHAAVSKANEKQIEKETQDKATAAKESGQNQFAR